MGQIVERITERAKEDLRRYGEILGEYLGSEVSQYFPIGRRRLPKAKRLEAESLRDEREILQQRFGIGHNHEYRGRWKLDMAGVAKSPGTEYSDMGFWQILPLNSGRRECLDYLALEVLPDIFEGRRFAVEDIMVPVDCCWVL